MVEPTIATSSESPQQFEHERSVDLEPVEREFLEVTEAGIPGAEVVEHDANAELLNLPEGVEHPLLVQQQNVFGHLQFEQRR